MLHEFPRAVGAREESSLIRMRLQRYPEGAGDLERLEVHSGPPVELGVDLAGALQITQLLQPREGAEA